MAHGGKREGAGRKATNGPQKMVSFQLPVSAIEAISARFGNVSAFIRAAVMDKLQSEVESLPETIFGTEVKPLPCLPVATAKVSRKATRRDSTIKQLLACEPATMQEYILQRLLAGLKVNPVDYTRETGFGRTIGRAGKTGITEIKQAKWMLSPDAADLDTIAMQLTEGFNNGMTSYTDNTEARAILCEILRTHTDKLSIVTDLRASFEHPGTGEIITSLTERAQAIQEYQYSLELAGLDIEVEMGPDSFDAVNDQLSPAAHYFLQTEPINEPITGAGDIYLSNEVQTIVQYKAGRTMENAKQGTINIK